MMTIKKAFAAAIVSMVMVVSVTPVTAFASEGQALSVAAGQEQVLGGWSLVTNNKTSMMSETYSNRINEVLKESGANFQIIDIVATQIVSGMNYMYLAYGTYGDSTVPAYYFVTVYENTAGIDSLIGITPIDVTAVQTAAPHGTGSLGGWTVKGSGKAGMLPDQDAQASFDAINKGDVVYNPVALLATQVVSGINYKALCKGSDKNLYVVTWYKDLQGNASFTAAECVNIGAYSGI